MSGEPWTCLHDGRKHFADVREIERTREGYSTEIGIGRCETCGGLYRWERYELNDWSGGHDYSDETNIWQLLAADEVDLVRADYNYTPRDGRQHRSDSGWRRDGPIETRPSLGERLQRLVRKAFWD